MDEDGDTDCLKDDMPSLPLRHVRRQKSMVPGLDELGIWELVGDWWSDASRPAPEADVRVAPPAGDNLHVDERAPPEGAVPATEEAIAHPAELALDPNEAAWDLEPEAGAVVQDTEKEEAASDLARALAHSRTEAEALPLSRDGVTLFRLTRNHRSSEVVSLLMNPQEAIRVEIDTQAQKLEEPERRRRPSSLTVAWTARAQEFRQAGGERGA